MLNTIIHQIKTDDNKKLGKWADLYEQRGKSHIVGCSFAVVKNYGKEFQAKHVIQEFFKIKKQTSEKFHSCS